MTDFLPDIIPVVIVTGFLGAGKTSLLNSLLSDFLLSRYGRRR